MSEEDIAAGARWSDEIAAQLDECDFGVVVVTPENAARPWLNFEAGALAKSYQSARVCPLTVRMRPEDVESPLSSFQAMPSTKEGLLRLLESINAESATPLDADRLSASFESHWPQFEKALAEASVAPAETENTAPRRDVADLLGELVERVRRIERTLDPPEPASGLNFADPHWYQNGLVVTPGAKVRHASFGEGTVQSTGDGFANVKFADGSSRRLMLAYAPLELLS